MDKPLKNNVTKIYCEKCDLVVESREKYEKHMASHFSGVACEECPIDIAISKIVNMFRKMLSRDLE